MQKENTRPGFLGKLMQDGTVLTILKRLEEIRNVNESEITELYSPYKNLNVVLYMILISMLKKKRKWMIF